jgi:uncharacterized protein DUF4255
MIDQLDVTLRRLFTTRVPGITSDAQVKFQPPDEVWRGYVKTLTVGGNPANALNVYLVDLRENRKLRSNERERATLNGNVQDTVSPRRVDCHYLISAWSPADVTPAIEPTLDEHALLYDVARVLTSTDPLAPDDVFAPAAPPPLMAGEVLPTILLPPEAFIKLAEFWGTMGDQHRWRPCVYLIVTVPTRFAPGPAGPPVTTVLADTRAADAAATAEVLAVIGGVVRTGAPLVPVDRAWVELLTPLNVRLQLARTDADGHFTFAHVQPGNYQLRASSATLGPSPPRAIDVPSPTGEYDLTL